MAENRKAPPLKIQTVTCKRAACGLAGRPYQRAKPINLPSNATDASRGRPPAFFDEERRTATGRMLRDEYSFKEARLVVRKSTHVHRTRAGVASGKEALRFSDT